MKEQTERDGSEIEGGGGRSKGQGFGEHETEGKG